MGREGESQTKTFKTKEQAEKYANTLKQRNIANWKNNDGGFDQGHDGYASAKTRVLKQKISGKPRKECIDKLEKKARKRLGDDSEMFILIAEIEPQELSGSVISDLDAHAYEVGKASGRASKKTKMAVIMRGGKKKKDGTVAAKPFVKCSNCESQFAQQHLKKNRGKCPLCQTEYVEYTRRNGGNVESELSVIETKMLDTSGNAFKEGFSKECPDSKSHPSLEFRFLYGKAHQKAIQTARKGVLEWGEREKELRKHPERAKKKRKRSAVPSIPVPKSKNGFQLFGAENKERIKRKNPDVKGLGLQKKINDEWASLSDEQKKPFQDRGKEGSEKRKRTIEEWKTNNPKEAEEIERKQKKKKEQSAEEKKMWVLVMTAISGHF